MSISVNRVIIAGVLGRDPQVRFLANEKAVASFSIAVNERFKDKNGEAKESTTWVDCEAWGRTAELVGQYLTKGKACLIDGRLKQDSWEKDGVKHTKLKVVAESVQFLGGKSDGERQDVASDTAAAPQKQAKAMAQEAPAKSQFSGTPAEDEPPFARFDMPA